MEAAGIAQSVLSACILGVMAFYGKRIVSSVRLLKTDLTALKDSNRNQLKASIVRTCNEALSQGWIYATELETLMKRFESYQALGGNSYVEALIEHVLQLEVRGDVPAHD